MFQKFEIINIAKLRVCIWFYRKSTFNWFNDWEMTKCGRMDTMYRSMVWSFWYMRSMCARLCVCVYVSAAIHLRFMWFMNWKFQNENFTLDLRLFSSMRVICFEVCLVLKFNMESIIFIFCRILQRHCVPYHYSLPYIRTWLLCFWYVETIVMTFKCCMHLNFMHNCTHTHSFSLHIPFSSLTILIRQLHTHHSYSLVAIEPIHKWYNVNVQPHG